jgi:hypothetical protein
VNNLLVTVPQNLPDDLTQRIQSGLSVRFLAISFHATGIAWLSRKQGDAGEVRKIGEPSFKPPLVIL